ncbi:MAG TPA: hybrid sensor histidine kinase/response regulator [Coleofasciculaceae cyanobacterium]
MIMLESSGSILQLQSRATALSKVNLLIISDRTDNFKAIANSLHTANINFTYDLIDTQHLSEKLPQLNYSAILYDYIQIPDQNSDRSLIETLQCWCHIHPDTPLILITDTLGDERAVKLIQSGVSGYILRHKLERLPNTLEKTLYNFASQRAIIKQQQNLIEQQQQKIRHLEAQQPSWHEQEQARHEHISHLVHEFRSPIAAIIGFARALKEQYYGKLNDKQKEYAGFLVDSGEHLLALVKNYLEITKIDANKETLDLERIAVVEICQASILMVAEKAKIKGLKLDFELDDKIDFCVADSIRLKQILINLLSNAIKFTDRGSVILKVSLQDDDLHFAVIDTGTGISKENMSKLFQPFPQITNHHENTGLGLTLSKKLAQLHGGDIMVTSKLDKGSCFTLTIPQYQFN